MIGKYRTAEEDFIDMTSKDARQFLATNYPAIMNERPINMSDEYQFMPSFKIAENLQSMFDLKLVEVHQQFSRRRDPRGQEHYMKFRLPSGLSELTKVGDSKPELVIMNSHNGRSTIRAYAGVFRLVCSNGMVVSERSFGQIKLRHFGERNSFEEFSKIIGGMAERLAVLDSRMALMNELILTKHMQNQLAKEMIKVRKAPDWLEAKDVLEARRVDDATSEDGKRSLWLTYNVIQENLTSRTINHTAQDVRARSIRPLSGARADLTTNERLWATLESFLEEKFPKVAKEAFEAVEDVKELEEA